MAQIICLGEEQGALCGNKWPCQSGGLAATRTREDKMAELPKNMGRILSSEGILAADLGGFHGPNDWKENDLIHANPILQLSRLIAY